MTMGAGWRWFWHVPGWYRASLLMFVIGLIPVLGQVALLGWVMATCDNLRAGRRFLPPAGFGHLERGLAPFVATAGWGAILTLVPLLLFDAAALAAGSRMTGAAGLDPGAVAGVTGGPLLALLVLSFALGCGTPLLLLAGDRGGFAAAFRLGWLWSVIRGRPGALLAAGSWFALLALLSSAGLLACCLGVLVSGPILAPGLAGLTVGYETEVWGAQPPVRGGPAPGP